MRNWEIKVRAVGKDDEVFEFTRNTKAESVANALDDCIDDMENARKVGDDAFKEEFVVEFSFSARCIDQDIVRGTHA